MTKKYYALSNESNLKQLCFFWGGRVSHKRGRICIDSLNTREKSINHVKATNGGNLLYLEPRVVALIISLPGNFS